MVGNLKMQAKTTLKLLNKPLRHSSSARPAKKCPKNDSCTAWGALTNFSRKLCLTTFFSALDTFMLSQITTSKTRKQFSSYIQFSYQKKIQKQHSRSNSITTSTAYNNTFHTMLHQFLMNGFSVFFKQTHE